MSTRNPPSTRGSKHGKRHTKTVGRWAKRKKEEAAASLNERIDDLTMAGSRHQLWQRQCYRERVKADLRRKEREMLATTSLKDLIK